MAFFGAVAGGALLAAFLVKATESRVVFVAWLLAAVAVILLFDDEIKALGAM
ncbi:hypothetical protein [Rhodobium gokarnense]|uniref:Uncharacterized protein n=1 Tax=Rhodobium gokarnense TaxID=364296 RepID=A0ABT3HH12_9HYPH|nr:hypothetical protein [Rhodobium gokarnense]MCW2309687.1 hypothetical protein [Rhodobium gokarnense]